MQIALIGAEGQLGRTLQQRLGGQIIALGHSDIELTDVVRVEAAIAAANPELVINAAAYNQVDRAEDEPEIAFAVNALGPRNLAIACRDRNIPLLHVSTDYVFSGRELVDANDPHHKKSYCETDCPEPQSAYGLSKLAGELFVRALCPQHFVVRTCGLYGPAMKPGYGNFVQTMLRLGRDRAEVSVVDDQICCPTSTADLASAIEALISTDAYGLYHATNSGSVTWCEFTREIFRLAGLETTVLHISTTEFGAKAARPCYSLLDCSKLKDVIGSEMPAWEEALAEYLGDE